MMQFDPMGPALAQFDEMASSLAQLQAESRAMLGAQPTEPISATDSSGAVTARLDPAGTLQELVVARDWKMRVRPEGLGHACEQAVERALETRKDQWSTNIEQAQTDLGDNTPCPVADVSPVGQVRPIEELAALVTFDVPERPTPPSLREGVHAGTEDRVRIQGVAGASFAVILNQAWLASAPTAELNAQLAECVTSMRRDEPGFDGLYAEMRQRNRDLDGVIGELMMHLKRSQETS